MLQRNGKLKAMVVPSVTAKVLCLTVAKHVKISATLMTDEWKAYNPLKVLYSHNIVEHGKGLYVDGDCYTNGLENFWSQMKRSLGGIYVKVSRKHLNKYVQESVFRFNYRNLGVQQQIDRLICNMECRIKYKELIAS